MPPADFIAQLYRFFAAHEAALYLARSGGDREDVKRHYDDAEATLAAARAFSRFAHAEARVQAARAQKLDLIPVATALVQERRKYQVVVRNASEAMARYDEAVTAGRIPPQAEASPEVVRRVGDWYSSIADNLRSELSPDVPDIALSVLWRLADVERSHFHERVRLLDVVVQWLVREDSARAFYDGLPVRLPDPPDALGQEMWLLEEQRRDERLAEVFTADRPGYRDHLPRSDRMAETVRQMRRDAHPLSREEAYEIVVREASASAPNSFWSMPLHAAATLSQVETATLELAHEAALAQELRERGMPVPQGLERHLQARIHGLTGPWALDDALRMIDEVDPPLPHAEILRGEIAGRMRREVREMAGVDPVPDLLARYGRSPLDARDAADLEVALAQERQFAADSLLAQLPEQAWESLGMGEAQAEDQGLRAAMASMAARHAEYPEAVRRVHAAELALHPVPAVKRPVPRRRRAAESRWHLTLPEPGWPAEKVSRERAKGARPL